MVLTMNENTKKGLGLALLLYLAVAIGGMSFALLISGRPYMSAFVGCVLPIAGFIIGNNVKGDVK